MTYIIPNFKVSSASDWSKIFEYLSKNHIFYKNVWPEFVSAFDGYYDQGYTEVYFENDEELIIFRLKFPV